MLKRGQATYGYQGHLVQPRKKTKKARPARSKTPQPQVRGKARSRSKTPVRSKTPEFRAKTPTKERITQTHAAGRHVRKEKHETKYKQVREERREARELQETKHKRRADSPQLRKAAKRERPLSVPNVPTAPKYPKVKLSEFDPLTAQQGAEFRRKQQEREAARRAQYAREPSPSPGPVTREQPRYDPHMQQDSGATQRVVRLPTPQAPTPPPRQRPRAPTPPTRTREELVPEQVARNVK